MARRIAIIGAGVSGLSSIKCCLEEGLEPICFERTQDIGGLWRFEEEPEDERASIYRSVIINTSKEMMCFSDYPIPEDFPNYMHNSKIMDYFRMYAKAFDLLKHIRFQTTVCSIKKRPDFSTSGQWDVVTESAGKQESSVFDGIMVCSGHHTFPHMPLECFPGIERFRGRYLHSRDYKSPQTFAEQRVVVIGLGNSGGDLAVEISQTAKQVFLSTRRGGWIMNRVGDNGYPIDVLLNTRFNLAIKQLLTLSILNLWLEKRMNARFNHEMYGLKPRHRALSQHPTINDDLPNRIISGRVLVKANVTGFTETAVLFEDGTREEDIDAVIFATGYSFAFPFLEDSIRVVKNKVCLYHHVFPPQLEKPTLAFIGLVQPLGAIMPISELQGRWATQVFQGLKKLPTESEMQAEITKTRMKMEHRYVESQRHTIQVDYMEYMEELADLVGVRPRLLSLALTDPRLAFEMYFGPCTPLQYRLQGRGKWEGARPAILAQRKRIIKPLQTRSLKPDGPSTSAVILLKVGLAVAILAFILVYV
ncbi:flavin-containing monooxygenase 5 [Tachyglossus aculeatus]|uniref:flavin-containing monooxygenase 5 n=1 Tax=Tachyglossus aculeatus TaxID=9261 RepID=UPI0018F48175|nr:flavin-containing monooxygenase 5 [Tachyglossus aculeatus]